MKLWGGRFVPQQNKMIEQFLASINFDQVLLPYDIIGSIAHAKMLAKVNLITQTEAEHLVTGLKSVYQKCQTGELKFSDAHEDVHMNVEALLTAEIGEVACKLHTGRSRNDQVALDTHLFLREQSVIILSSILKLQKSLIQQARNHIDTILPGYTHLQRAQPVSLAHHFLAYAWMLQRDAQRLAAHWADLNVLPLGSGALAGSDLPLDRAYVAEILKMDQLYLNSMDAVSNRDYIVEFHSDCSLIMMHLSRLCEEIILWSSQEFNFISLDDNVCTGSSIMPQKKNPDIAELVRGKTGRVYGNLMALLTTLKALPLAYNKDLQEDKEALFDSVKTVQNCLAALNPVVETMKIHKDKMLAAVENDFSLATMLANYLVKKNVPFRTAHHSVGQIVQHCLTEHKNLTELTLKDLKTFHASFEQDVLLVLDAKSAVAAHVTAGSTGASAIEQQFQVLEKAQHQLTNSLQQKQLILESVYDNLL